MMTEDNNAQLTTIKSAEQAVAVGFHRTVTNVDSIDVNIENFDIDVDTRHIKHCHMTS